MRRAQNKSKRAAGASVTKSVLYAIGFLMPWVIRRKFLNAMFGYQIHPTSRIGFAWIMPTKLVMEANSNIGNLTICKGMRLVHLKQNSIIGKANWISGFPVQDPTHFAHEFDRQPELVLGEHAAITSRHLIDCTNSVRIGAFATVAGFRSQLLTHSIDLGVNRQASRPIKIGDYCFIGTGCVLLGGCVLPHHSVLGANSLLNKEYTKSYCLYAGSPARAIKHLDEDMGYFTREFGCVT